jgi:chromosomal replication initiator protein
MVVDISLPDLETRIAILKAKCEAREPRISVPEDVLAYVAVQVASNIRELEGCLNRVLVQCELQGETLTLPRVREILGGLLAQPKRRVIHTDRIVDAVSSYYHVPVSDLIGEGRRREVVRPRQVAMYLLRSENGFSFPTIGQHFGNRDHTTVMHACGKIEENLETDEVLRQDIVTIRQKLYVAVGV